MPGEAGILIAGRYVLSEPVGQGATGRVWRARDQLLDRDVAVKEVLIPPQSAQDSALTVARVAREAELAREAQAAAGLDHPDAVTFYDVAEQDGALWIVTRFVPGTSLSAEIGRLGRLPWQRAARIAGQVAEALARAHGAGLVHRDLKPGNILLTGPSADRAVVAGFGISPVLDFRTRLTDAEARVGGFAYLAPEQLTGFYDLPPADMWALGAALYTAVEGRPPFTGSTVPAVLRAIFYEPVTVPEFAGPLRDLIGSLLAKDPADRPDAQAAAAALAGLAVGPGTAGTWAAGTAAEPPPAGTGPAETGPAETWTAAPAPPGPRLVAAAVGPSPDTMATVPREDHNRPPAGIAAALAARPTTPPRRRIPVVTSVAEAARANPRLTVGLATALAMVLVLILVTLIFTPAHQPGQQSPGSPRTSPSATVAP